MPDECRTPRFVKLSKTKSIYTNTETVSVQDSMMPGVAVGDKRLAGGIKPGAGCMDSAASAPCTLSEGVQPISTRTAVRNERKNIYTHGYSWKEIIKENQLVHVDFPR